MTDLITDPSGWGAAVTGPVIKTQLVDPINAWTADTGYITSGILTPGTGITINNQTGRVIGNVAWLYVNYSVGAGAGTPITPPASDDIANVIVATITDTRFQTSSLFTAQGLSTASVGRLAAHAVRTATDDIILSAIAGTANIVAGDSFTFSGCYLLD